MQEFLCQRVQGICHQAREGSLIDPRRFLVAPFWEAGWGDDARAALPAAWSIAFVENVVQCDHLPHEADRLTQVHRYRTTRLALSSDVEARDFVDGVVAPRVGRYGTRAAEGLAHVLHFIRIFRRTQRQIAGGQAPALWQAAAALLTQLLWEFVSAYGWCPKEWALHVREWMKLMRPAAVELVTWRRCTQGSTAATQEAPTSAETQHET